MFKRITYFIITNIAFVITISIIYSLLSIFFPQLNNNNITSIFIYSLLFGFISAFTSLFMSKFIAKKFNNIKIIKENIYSNHEERKIYELVKRNSELLGIKTPEIGIYYDEQPNAFATGWSKNNSLVAVSSGLLNIMNDKEIEAVICHELAHVKNGDMVTMTLITGVVNTFIIMLSRIIQNAIIELTDNSIGLIISIFINILITTLLSFMTYPIIAFFSRKREFKADKGSADLIGKYNMISALKTLERYLSINNMKENNLKEFASFGIMPTYKIKKLFSTHPTFEKRIEALEKI